ncbi:hypothetical protein [Streptomyces acidiscabies]|uniref:hypothetical protein n=1 Tax=Streptomyces acidiscabies TaxID=42234 RepID=UPI0002887072|nr:hypothetical protein [Streptomyces acidiscabies]
MTRTPQDTFLSDQTLAAARDAAADPGLVPVAVTAANGETCTWCDCPDGPNSPHNQPDYRCGGCPTPAKYIVSTFAGPDIRFDYPACDRHHTGIVAAVAHLAGGAR